MYVCAGCDELISRHRDLFLDDGVFWEGGVRESMLEEKVKTPEELIKKWESVKV